MQSFLHPALMFQGKKDDEEQEEKLKQELPQSNHFRLDCRRGRGLLRRSNEEALWLRNELLLDLFKHVTSSIIAVTATAPKKEPMT